MELDKSQDRDSRDELLPTVPFEIIDATTWDAISEETMGAKRKLWLQDAATSNQSRRWLFKHIRSETSGEDWAEKAVESIARVLGIPHARVELATRGGEKGVLVRDFCQTSTEAGPQEFLLHGNELLGRVEPSYPTDKTFRVAEHRIDLIFHALRVFRAEVPHPIWDVPLPTSFDAQDVFVGYLLLDALVANQDRHHENWGIVVHANSGAEWLATLAPSYDHASSLAFNESDARRQVILDAKSSGFNVDRYIRRANSAIYGTNSKKSLSTIDAFRLAAEFRKVAGDFWLGRLRNCEEHAIERIFRSIPTPRMSMIAKRFAIEIVKANRRRLLGDEK